MGGAIMSACKFIYSIGFLLTFVSFAYGANILCVATCFSASHLKVHMAHVPTLLDRGHNVTVVTSLPLKQKDPRIHHIFIPLNEDTSKVVSTGLKSMTNSANGWSVILDIHTFLLAYAYGHYDILKDTRFQEFLRDRGNKFDLILIGYSYIDLYYGIGLHFDCPIILSVSTALHYAVDRHVGNPLQISYSPMMPVFEISGQISFRTRMVHFLQSAMMIILLTLVSDRTNDKYYRELFPPTQYGSFNEARDKVSLILINSHFSEGIIRPNVPAVIEVGGVQLKPQPDPLPNDLAKILDSSSEYGVIYISFGTNAKSELFQPSLIESIYNVIAGLKQTVIWKWADELPGNASNIHRRSWFPQEDILAHPNLKLFVTHGGKGSTSEALYHAVPMLVIPLFGDQHQNSYHVARKGCGFVTDFKSLTAETFKAGVLEVLTNPKYKINIDNCSTTYKDRPMSPRNTSAFWIEYVLRHKGARHMQSPLVHLNLLQYMSLDVIAFLLFIIFLIYKFVIKIVKIITEILPKKSKTKEH